MRKSLFVFIYPVCLLFLTMKFLKLEPFFFVHKNSSDNGQILTLLKHNNEYQQLDHCSNS